jgi:HPt (histidine-containing phosphotransfer) domain-containing protein
MAAHAMKGDAERCLAAGMDGYLSKPIKADELYGIIQKALHREAGPDTCSAEPPVDVATLMTIVGGEKDLMMDLGRIFRQDYPKQVEVLREAIRQGDKRGIEHIAHSLRGALATIGATTARSLAYELESMGQTSQLERAQSVFHKLEAELGRLVTFLEDPSWLDPM